MNRSLVDAVRNEIEVIERAIHKVGWENVRWTGVLEKRDGKWVHTQMHFSFPTG